MMMQKKMMMAIMSLLIICCSFEIGLSQCPGGMCQVGQQTYPTSGNVQAVETSNGGLAFSVDQPDSGVTLPSRSQNFNTEVTRGQFTVDSSGEASTVANKELELWGAMITEGGEASKAYNEYRAKVSSETAMPINPKNPEDGGVTFKEDGSVSVGRGKRFLKGLFKVVFFPIFLIKKGVSKAGARDQAQRPVMEVTQDGVSRVSGNRGNGPKTTFTSQDNQYQVASYTDQSGTNRMAAGKMSPCGPQGCTPQVQAAAGAKAPPAVLKPETAADKQIPATTPAAQKAPTTPAIKQTGASEEKKPEKKVTILAVTNIPEEDTGDYGEEMVYYVFEDLSPLKLFVYGHSLDYKETLETSISAHK